MSSIDLHEVMILGDESLDAVDEAPLKLFRHAMLAECPDGCVRIQHELGANSTNPKPLKGVASGRSGDASKRGFKSILEDKRL